MKLITFDELRNKLGGRARSSIYLDLEHARLPTPLKLGGRLYWEEGPAMAAGCPIIIRPSDATPISAYAVGALCEKIGLPKGIVQILATESYAVADALSASTIPQVITLIG